MNVCFFGFSAMDFKGEEINEPVFLKEMVDEFEKRGIQTFYLFNDGGSGINDENVYNLLEIKSKRLCLDKYTNFTYKEFEKYSNEELFSIIEFNYQLALLNTNKDISQKLNYTVLKCLESLKEYDLQYNIDLFIFFGNSLYSNIIRSYCIKNNKNYFNMENGYFRPFTLMVDPKGVNYDSTIPRETEFYSSVVVDKERLTKYLHQPEVTKVNRTDTLPLRKTFYDYYDLTIEDKELVKDVKKSDFSTVHEELYLQDYIYIPFQLETDSQIIKHSKTIKSMRQLVEVTSNALREFNKSNNTDLKIIYKTHPLYKSELNIIDLDGIERICNSSENLIFLTEGDNKKLVENAKAVITINSTVGLEALLFSKPVITLGEAFYGIEEISYPCKDLNDLPLLIEKALSTSVNKEMIDKFIYYLRFDYFHEIFRSNPDKQSIKRLVDRFLLI
ncbi:hypothetical protein [Mesobacillus thioparans]|uniref:capsular polysaccharide export protein, LipB/KpsS family n=1 Tax=Mesobacillus thioparans TaxID=370439 RepID=UPI0039EF2FA0